MDDLFYFKNEEISYLSTANIRKDSHCVRAHEPSSVPLLDKNDALVAEHGPRTKEQKSSNKAQTEGTEQENDWNEFVDPSRQANPKGKNSAKWVTYS